MNGTGISAWGTLAAGLKRGALTMNDVATVDMPFPDHVLAMTNGAVDASVTTEPSGTLMLQRGIAVAIAGDDELVPNHAIAQLVYPEEFVQKKADLGLRFMRAYLRAVRTQNASIVDGRLTGRDGEEFISLITAQTPVKDRELLRTLRLSSTDDNGQPNVASLEEDFEIFRAEGLLEGKITLQDALDPSFAKEAVAALGR
jgi:NitT/TauT family transport system substrate-binding protein